MLRVLALLLCAPCLLAQRVVSTFERDLPADLRWSADLRWADDRSVYLAVGKKGVYRLPIDSTTASPSLLTGFSFNNHLAVDGSLIVAASPWGGAVRDLRAQGAAAPFGFSAIVDIDARAGNIAILGATRDDKGRWAPEGAIAWSGKVDARVHDLHPVLFSESGPRVKKMNLCGSFDLGAIRFLDDTSLVIVPGSEPGVFLYGVDRKLRRAWQSSTLDFYDDCDLTHEKAQAVMGPPARDRWINSQAIVEDIIPLPGAIGLIIRKHKQNVTSWTLELLSIDSPAVRRIPLPFDSPSPLTHLRADVRGRSIAFLFSEYGDMNVPPLRAPRLVIAEYRP